ncbi:MAG: DUF2807 domain-containing protein [Alphaproteobacteria bacterium]|nr:DUF2807 domain-containing protein [Alphaproteobacteria bacterium]
MKHAKNIRRGVAGLAFAALAGSTFMTSTAGAAYVHDTHGKQTSSDRDHSGFTKIRIKGGFELKLEAGKDFSVKIEGDENDVAEVETFVRNDTLVIDNSDDHDDDDGIHIDSDNITVTVTMPTLEGFEVLGAVDAEMRGLKSEKLEVELKGAGAIEMEGTCGSLDIELKGAGEVDAEDLKCSDVEVDVKGVGEAKVFASESVDANVSGIGSITVYGDPKTVRESDSWLGKIRIK